MEFVGAFPEGDWESLMSKMFSAEDMEFSSHFLSHHSYPNSQNTIFDPSNIDTRDINVHQSLFHRHSLESDLNPQYQISQESTSTNSKTQESYNYVINNNDDSYHINTDEFFAPNFLMDQNAMENLPSNSHHHLKRNIHEENAIAVEMSDQNPKKKPRVQRSKKSSSKAGPEKGKIEELENGNTSSNSSEDENTPQDNNGSSVVTLSGKARASRGSATDPQSLYARKRRERINERLKILQNIVPNGNKVDISTMLEEAVHYVKFLQLQIKLLSSDDMWMYAPIAYNGMDIGLTNKLSELV